MEPVRIAPSRPGRVSATAWRTLTREALAASPRVGPAALRLDFTLPAGQFVDLDTLVEAAVAGLRDATRYGRGAAGLDALLATRSDGPSQLTIAPLGGPHRSTPSESLLDLPLEAVPRDAAGKVSLRARIAAAWGARAPLEGEVWAQVLTAGGGALLGGLEATLDCLEPVLGRDPRGRSWQLHFPNDHRIRWLHVRRDERGRRLRLGSLT